MLIAKLISVLMLIGLSNSALIYQRTSKPEERYVFEDEGDILSARLPVLSSKDVAMEPEYYMPSDYIREQFEKDDKEIMDRIAQIFNEEFRYEKVPDYDSKETKGTSTSSDVH